MLRFRAIAAAAVIWVAACAPARAETLSDDGATRFAFLEQSLLSAKQIEFGYRLESTGALASDLGGRASIGHDNTAEIDARGSFGGKTVTLKLTSSGGHLRGGAGDQTFEVATPPALSEALVVGFMRMGILHNHAMLTAGQPPDHANGAAKEWAVVQNLRVGERSAIDGTQAWPLVFDIVVSGKPAGSATLWLSEETGLPLRRTQRVDFGSNQTMSVSEEYRDFTVQHRQPVDVVMSRNDAFARRDLEAVLGVYSPSVRVFDHPAAVRFHGHAALRSAFEQQFAAIDSIMPAQVLAEVGPRVVVLDHASPPSIAIYEVDRGLIANVWLIEEAPPAQH
jgi:hypothetical protein